MNASPDLMSDPQAPPPVSISIQADPGQPKFNAVAALAALGNPIRWRALQMMTNGACVSATDVAADVRRDFDGVSKHLRLLRASGLVASKPFEADNRYQVYYIPAQFRIMPGILDYGFCVLRMI